MDGPEAELDGRQSDEEDIRRRGLLAARIGYGGESISIATCIPILAARCFACHGGDKRSGGLSLSNYSEILHGGKTGKVVNPGSSKDSLMMQRVLARRCSADAAGGRTAERDGDGGAARLDRRWRAAAHRCAAGAGRIGFRAWRFASRRFRKAPRRIRWTVSCALFSARILRPRPFPTRRSPGAPTSTCGDCCPRRNNWPLSPVRRARQAASAGDRSLLAEPHQLRRALDHLLERSAAQ